MLIIGESSSTRTEWTLCDGNRIVEHAFTTGLNPYFQTRREISHSIRLELPEAFFHRRWSHVYFYGAGCGTADKCKIMESSLVAQFKTPCTVQSDLLGAARGLLVREPGLVSILGTGSNTCLYDGNEVVKNVRPLGFILGDEGSNAHMGKQFLSDVLKELAPREIIDEFYDTYQVTANSLLEEVYSNTLRARAGLQLAHALLPTQHQPVRLRRKPHQLRWQHLRQLRGHPARRRRRLRRQNRQSHQILDAGPRRIPRRHRFTVLSN